MTTISEALKVTSRTQLVAFIRNLREEIIADPSQLENRTTEQYLEALEAYLNDLRGFVKNNQWPGSPDEATWSLFAAIISGATIYE